VIEGSYDKITKYGGLTFFSGPFPFSADATTWMKLTPSLPDWSLPAVLAPRQP
jgi:hypothetical protein